MPGLASFLIENDGSYSEKTIERYRLHTAGGPAMRLLWKHMVWLKWGWFPIIRPGFMMTDLYRRYQGQLK
jgi:hypothetical protein